MKEITEVKYDRLEIFCGSKRVIAITDPRTYNRKYNKEMGKLFIKILKDLTEK